MKKILWVLYFALYMIFTLVYKIKLEFLKWKHPERADAYAQQVIKK